LQRAKRLGDRPQDPGIVQLGQDCGEIPRDPIPLGGPIRCRTSKNGVAGTQRRTSIAGSRETAATSGSGNRGAAACSAPRVCA
jgi:hypothetical protein